MGRDQSQSRFLSTTIPQLHGHRPQPSHNSMGTAGSAARSKRERCLGTRQQLKNHSSNQGLSVLRLCPFTSHLIHVVSLFIPGHPGYKWIPAVTKPNKMLGNNRDRLVLQAMETMIMNDSMCAFLWDDLDQDQCSKISRIMVHERNR